MTGTISWLANDGITAPLEDDPGLIMIRSINEILNTCRAISDFARTVEQSGRGSRGPSRGGGH